MSLAADRAGVVRIILYDLDEVHEFVLVAIPHSSEK